MPTKERQTKTVVLATESFYPIISGVAVIVERLADYLIKKGYKVAVFTLSRNHALVKEERRGYTIYRIPSWPMPFRKGLRSTLFPDRIVKEILEEIKPSLIHFHDPALLSYAVVKFARKQNIPVMGTCHFTYDLLLTYLSPQLANITQRMNFRLYRQSNLLTVPTKTLKAELLEEGLKEVPIAVASNGVDFERFSSAVDTEAVRKSLGIPSSVPVFGYVGSMNPEKHVDLLIKACDLLKKDGLDFRCVLMGGGHSKEDLEDLALSLGVADRVIWLRKVDHSNKLLNEVMHLLDVFCIPSTIETESIVTMEAMAAHTPVLAANAKALVELVNDDVNGYLIDADEHAWAAKIKLLLEDGALRQRLGASAKAKVQKKDIHKALAEFEALYERLMP